MSHYDDESFEERVERYKYIDDMKKARENQEIREIKAKQARIKDYIDRGLL